MKFGMRSKIPLLLSVNVLIFFYILFIYSPNVPIKDDVTISCSVKTENDIHSNSSIKYISGYVKNFSNYTLYDLSVHIESDSKGESEIYSTDVGVLGPGEVKTYLIDLERYTNDFEIVKKWATYRKGN
ncbi:hypothetical protein GF319_15805 [Candidatus Bathyarchaeota archaeon]|nr:hypothetical protein [Candidatus Bathyarchaeota archaeon]